MRRCGIFNQGKRMKPMSQILEIPDPLYDKLLAAAKADGTTPVGWIAAQLRESSDKNGRQRALSTEEIAKANARLKKNMVSLGYATGCDNTQIDADLAREYGDEHATQ
jgi:hypothetical protein